MVWWKEWRETRFGFLTALIFVTGIYFRLPSRVTLDDSYFLGIFLAFFGMATAVVLGSSAIASEVGADTMTFLISKPAARAKLFAAKYVIRGTEAALVFICPVLCLIDWGNLQMWMWVPPYFMETYLLSGVLVILFAYSSTFLCSVLLRKQAPCALGGIVLTAAYFAFRGMPVLIKMRNLEGVGADLCLLVLFCVGASLASFFLFRVKEF